MITDKLLDIGIPYNKEDKNITWEDSTIRRWMNRIFLNEAFSDKEKRRIKETEVENKDNKEYGTDGGRDTKDRVFLLSIDEAKRYFSSDYDRRAEVTEYCKQKLRVLTIRFGKSEEIADEYIKNIEEKWDNCGDYFLRSPGCYQYNAAHVYNDGSVYEDGLVDVVLGGDRPALWVNL